MSSPIVTPQPIRPHTVSNPVLSAGLAAGLTAVPAGLVGGAPVEPPKAAETAPEPPQNAPNGPPTQKAAASGNISMRAVLELAGWALHPPTNEDEYELRRQRIREFLLSYTDVFAPALPE